MTRVLPLTLAALAVASIVGCASNPDMPNTYRGKTAQFEEMDKTGDNRLTLDEINPDLVLHREFERWDVNGNGLIEENEFFDYVEAQ